MEKFGPATPNSMETRPLAMLLIIIGIMKGEIRLGPLFMRMVCCSQRVFKPPMPLPMTQPKRSRFTFSRSTPESAIAILAAAMPNCVKRSVRRTSLGLLKKGVALKSLTSPAIWQSKHAGSNEAMRSMPLRPLVKESQKVTRSFPTGVTTPIPVMTTLRSMDIKCRILHGSGPRCNRKMPYQSFRVIVSGSRARCNSSSGRIFQSRQISRMVRPLSALSWAISAARS